MKLRTFFGCFNLGIAVICMLDNTDFAFNDLFHNGHIGCCVIFDCIIFRVCTYLIHRVIKQISLTRSNFLYRPICSANIIVGSKRTVLICCVLSNKLIAFEQTIYGTAEFCIALCITFFVVLLCYGYSEFFEYIGKLNGCSLSANNSNRFCILRYIFAICIFAYLIITRRKIINLNFAVCIGGYIF